jgi:hypothetical protein
MLLRTILNDTPPAGPCQSACLQKQRARETMAGARRSTRGPAYGLGFDDCGSYVPHTAPPAPTSTRISSAWHSLFSLWRQSVAAQDATVDACDLALSCGFAIDGLLAGAVFVGSPHTSRNLRTAAVVNRLPAMRCE